jgi:hypothetical protein
MGDMGEVFREMRTDIKEKKSMNLKNNLDFLNSMEYDYEVHNHGYQLNFKTKQGSVSFYPSANKWVLKQKVYYGDALALIEWLEERRGPNGFNWD